MPTSRAVPAVVRALSLCLVAGCVACGSGSGGQPENTESELPASEMPVAEPVGNEPEAQEPLEGEPASTEAVDVENEPPAVEAVEVEPVEPLPRLPIIVGDQPGEAQCLHLQRTTREFGQVSWQDWENWVGNVRFAVGTEFLEIPDRGEGIPELRQQFVPASNGSPRVVVAADLAPARMYRVVQSIYFEDGWDWGGDSFEGGKIGFGLSGGTSPTGGVIDTAGFSARLTWRGNLNGSARIAIYSYAADRPGAFGDSVDFGEFLAPIGEWFELAFEIQANSSTDVADGRMRAWANGHLVLDRSGVAWQTTGGMPVVDNLYYSSFYGGSSPQWSPDRTTYARVRDACWAAVVDGYSGIDPDAGRLVVNRVSRSAVAGKAVQQLSVQTDSASSTVGNLLEAASSILSTMLELPDLTAAENPMLLDTAALLRAAYSEAESFDPVDAGQRARTLGYVRRATGLLQQSIDLRTQRDQPADVELRLSAELSRISALLAPPNEPGSRP